MELKHIKVRFSELILQNEYDILKSEMKFKCVIQSQEESRECDREGEEEGPGLQYSRLMNGKIKKVNYQQKDEVTIVVEKYIPR